MQTPMLTGTLYFFRALPTLTARCPTMIMLAKPVRTTYPYSLERTTILTDLSVQILLGQFHAVPLQTKKDVSALTHSKTSISRWKTNTPIVVRHGLTVAKRIIKVSTNKCKNITLK